MLVDAALEEVWCEFVDDLTLIWRRGGQPLVEFVQVKTDNVGQLWTVALLCAREAKKAGTSILERSLSRATCTESCIFRLITVVECAPALTPLRLDLGEAGRAHALTEPIVLDVQEKLPDVPRGGRDTRFWVENAVWDVRGPEVAVKNANLLRLADFLAAFGVSFPDQVSDVAGSLLAVAYRAGTAGGDDKKLTKTQVMVNVKARVQGLKEKPTRNRLRTELDALGLPPETLDDIIWRRVEYSSARKRGAYSTRYDSLDATEALQNRLHALRLRYEAGMLSDTPSQFHIRCLDEVGLLKAKVPELADVPIRQLEGALYDLVERGLHSFQRATP